MTEAVPGSPRSTPRAGLRIGFATPTELWDADLDAKHETLQRLDAAGVDHLYMADHVSFRDGSGTDGFVEIAALSQLHPDLGVMISVYLLALRHPVTVARQLATIATIAPGRVLFGVGVGGDDRHEIEVCGVDPRTRGRRTDESLTVLRQCMTGDPVSHSGEFFSFDEARIRPKVDPPVPIIIGGRSDAALARTARFGDGWIGAWCSVRRFSEAVGIIEQAAVDQGRLETDWRHGYQPWVGVGDDATSARRVVAQQMEGFYQVPFEAFEKYVPYGTPSDVARALGPYVEAGCSILNLKVAAATDDESIAGGAEIIAGLRSG